MCLEFGPHFTSDLLLAILFTLTTLSVANCHQSGRGFDIIECIKIFLVQTAGLLLVLGMISAYYYLINLMP